MSISGGKQSPTQGSPLTAGPVARAPQASDQVKSEVLRAMPINGDDSLDGDGPSFPRPPHKSWRRLAGASLVIAGLVAGGILVLHSADLNKRQHILNATLADQSSRVKTQDIELPSLVQQLAGTIATQQLDTLTVNGQLKVNGSLVVGGTTRPSSPTPGQLYFDQGSHQLEYYNGSSFVALQPTKAGAPPASSSNITNITNNVNTGAIKSAGGIDGVLAMFTSGDTVGNSLVSQNGATIGIAGNINLQSGSSYEIGGSPLSSTSLSDYTGLAKLNAPQTYTAANTFADNSGSTTAFQVQDSTNKNLINVDTTHDTVNLGATGNTAASSTTNIGTSTGAAQTVNIANGTSETATAAIGSMYASSATTIQGGTGNVSVTTGATSGTSGGITLQTGNSSTTAAGNITIDTGSSTVSGTNVADLTFESGTENMVCAVSCTLAQSSAEAHSGTSSLAITATNSNWQVAPTQPYPILLTPGHTYYVSAWLRAGSNPATIIGYAYYSANGYGTFTGQGQWGTVTDNATGWTQMTGTFTAPPGTNSLALVIYTQTNATVGDIHYLDDVTVTDMNSSSAMAELNLGTSNAQKVTIGNTNQLNVTQIFGTGINISAGAGNLNITAGAIAIRPQADSTAALEIQNSYGYALLTVDSTNGIITVPNLVTAGTLTIDSHIITGGSTPTIAAGTAACTTPAVSVSGNDTSGTITVTTGTSCSGSGDLATITFASAFASTPHAVLTPDNAAAPNLSTYINGAASTASSFTISTLATPTASTTYQWNYWNAQ